MAVVTMAVTVMVVAMVATVHDGIVLLEMAVLIVEVVVAVFVGGYWKWWE